MTEHVAGTDGMEQLVDDLRRTTSALEQALADADRAASRLHAVWSGEAASAHRGAHDRWARDAETMNASIAALRALVATARANYSSAAAVNERMWS